MIYEMKREMFKAAIELPVSWTEPVAERIVRVTGKRGMGRYIWAAAALWIMKSDDAELLAAASELRELATFHRGLARHPRE